MHTSLMRSLFLAFSLFPVPFATAPAGLLALLAPQEAQAEVPSVWTGRVTDKAGKQHEEPLTKTYAGDLRRDLAGLRVTVDVDRALDEAAATSLTLWIRASRAGYPERNDVLIETLLLRAKILQALNRGPAAVTELSTVFPVIPADLGFESRPLLMDDRYVTTAVARDPRIVQARESIANPRAASSPQAGEDKIGSIVTDALTRGDVSLSQSLGERAVPALVARVEANLDEFPPILNDPLFHLTAVNNARSAELVAGAYSKGGQIWKARVLRLLNSGVFSEGQTQLANLWKPAQTDRDPPTFAVPRWFDVLELLLVDPATKREAVQLLRMLPERNALTPGILHAVTAILMDPSTTLTPDILSLLRFGGGRPTVKTLYESVLASPWPEVRKSAASFLAGTDRSDALIAASRHTDPEVRRIVAYSLRGHYQTFPQYPSGSRTQYFAPKVLPNDRVVLTELASDADPTVRVSAATTIATLTPPLDSAVYEKLARDPDSRVRVAVLEAASLPVEQRAKLALGLATDTDESVLVSLDQSLKALGDVSQSEIVPDVWIPVLRARRENKALEFERDNSPWSSIYDRLGNSTPGMRALADWIVTDQSLRAQRAFANHLPLPRDQERTNPIDIDGAKLAKVYRIMAELPRENRQHVLARYLTAFENAPAAEFLALAEDASLDPGSRLGALAVAARGKLPRTGDALVAIFSAGEIVPIGMGGIGTEYVKLITSSLSDEQSKKTFDGLLANTSVNQGLVFDALNAIASLRPLSSSETDKVLARWFDDSMSNTSNIVTQALKSVSRRPRAEQGDWLVRAAHNARTTEWAFRLIGDTRHESYVELLRQALVGPFELTGGSASYKSPALNALTRYFDSRAADIILEAAGSTPDAAFRDECFKALETIRRYEAEKGRVARDRAAQAATTTAVRDLVTMLDDPSAVIRVQALRALATLGAIEEMPAIVRRLKDADESVRKAAEAALDTLNSPPANK